MYISWTIELIESLLHLNNFSENPFWLFKNELKHFINLAEFVSWTFGKIVDLVSYKNLDNRNKSKIKDIPIVIMAGGKGKRLKPFTDILPKPLIPINNKTILEHIILNFQSHGMNNFSFITHHKSAIIKSYLKEINLSAK